MMTKRFFFLTTVASVTILCAAAIAQDQPAVTPEEAPAETTIVPATEMVEEAPAVAEAVPTPEAKPVTESAPVAETVPAETPATPAAESEQTKTDSAVAAAPAEPVIPLPALSEDDPVEKLLLEQLRLRKPSVDIGKMPSLFLTVWERDLVINARKGQLARDPNAPEDVAAATTAEEPLSAFEGPRDLRLSGIVFRSPGDWVIWLNARRITPRAIPMEIMDLKVYKDYIEVEWFDRGTNQIFPVRLRPQQRFNMDARIFLPG